MSKFFWLTILVLMPLVAAVNFGQALPNPWNYWCAAACVVTAYILGHFFGLKRY